jgi:hypothetical protein
MQLGNQDLIVKVGGKPLKEYYHEGNFFVEGRKKSDFTIEVRNRGWQKVKVVMSVDGLSVMDGKPAGAESQGYVIHPYSTIEIEGWRVSDTAVNKFYFSGKGKSYNAKMGEDNKNIGVIGIMVFAEEVKPTYYSNLTFVPTTSPAGVWYSTNGVGTSVGRGTSLLSPGVSATEYDNTFVATTGDWLTTETTSFNASAPIQSSELNAIHTSTAVVGSNAPIAMAAAAPAPQNNLGTGWGAETESAVVTDYSTFNKNPDNILCIYYDDKEGLEKRGIIVDQKKSFPNAFPNYSSSGKYARRPIK